MVQGATNVRKVVGLAFLPAGFAGTVASSVLRFSSKCCRRCGAPMSKPTTPPEVAVAKFLEELKDNEHFKGSEELAAMHAKAEKALEADKLAKRNARPPKTSVHSVSTALQRQKAAQAKVQAKLVELAAAAKAAAEAVEEAKHKAIKLQEHIDWLQAEYDRGLARLVQTKDSVTHLRTFLRDAFQALSGCVEAQPLLTQLESAFTGLSSMLATATPTPAATDVRNDDIDMQPDTLPTDAHARAFERTLEGLSEEEREAKKQKFWEFVDEERAQASPQHYLLRLQPGWPSLAKILVGKDRPSLLSHHNKTTWTITTANVTVWKSGLLMLDTIPHSDFWALQETHVPGSEHMAAAQRFLRKQGWAASFQAAEMVEQHNLANRSGVASAGPLHISSSVPHEFESTLEDAAFMTPEGVERPLDFLRSRSLARHFHAMLKGGIT